MAWVAHQTVVDPRHLFDANIFFPERDTLAYSDHLFVQSMLGAPLLWAGASPVLVHNLVLLAGFALSAWAMCYVVIRWTGSRSAGLVAGSLAAFNAFSLTRLPQIQDLHVEFFPLALFALDRLFGAPRLRHALALAGWYLLQALTGTYLMVFTAISLVAAALSRPGEWLGPTWRRTLPLLALAAVVATVPLVPFLLPYARASESVGLSRSLTETAQYSAVPGDYLAAPGRLYFEWFGRRFFEGDALFPGIGALALAIAGVALSSRSDRRVRMLITIALVAFALSFGPAFPPYRLLYRIFPLLTGIRGAVRFGQIVLLAIAALAGFGVARLQQRMSAKPAAIFAIAALLVVNAEAIRAPLYYSEYRGIPPIYDQLTKLDRNAVIVWLPFPSSPQFHLNAPFMLVSTKTFFHRMLNGYSGFKPASYHTHADALRGFPDARSISYLQSVGVTAVLVDSRNMRPAALDRLPQFPQLTPWADDGNLRIFLLAPAAR